MLFYSSNRCYFYAGNRSGKSLLAFTFARLAPSVLLREGDEGHSLINVEVKNGHSPDSLLREAVNVLASSNIKYTIDRFAKGVEPVGTFLVEGEKVRAYCAIAQTSGISLLEKAYGRPIPCHSRLNRGSYWVGLDDISLQYLEPRSAKIIADFDEVYRYLKPESDYLGQNNGWGLREKIIAMNGSLRKIASESGGQIPTQTLWENAVYLWGTRDQRRPR